MDQSGPAYLRSYLSGELHQKKMTAAGLLYNCNMCPHHCGVERVTGQYGICSSGTKAKIYTYGPDFSVETVLIGENGAGTIVFAEDVLTCNYCATPYSGNYSQAREVSDEHLAEIMLLLQQQGCHNINLVNPSHVVLNVMAAVEIAAGKGLHIPLAYSSGGYDSTETLRLLSGVVDIYVPDFRFWEDETSERLCAVRNYAEVAQNALKEMYRQVGDLQVNEQGIAYKGIIVRHPVIPDRPEETENIMHFIVNEISPETYVNVTLQNFPCNNAEGISELTGELTQKDYDLALSVAREAGIKRLDKRKHVFKW